MRVLLVDVDSTIPNLALMRISSFHKNKGHRVELVRCNVSYYKNKRNSTGLKVTAYDKVYVSAVFKGTIDSVQIFSDKDNVTFGGTGIDLKINLPCSIEACDPDYSIYPENDTAYGFISRGCNRKCYFCVVPQKEGRVHQVEYDLNRIIGGFKKVKFMDNNFLQLPNHLDLLSQLAEKKIKCQFNQGLDIRLITEENSIALSKLSYLGDYIFAFDDWGYRRAVARKMELLKWIKPWRAKFFVYVHPDMPMSDTVKRIEFLKERKMLPYVMRDESCWESENSDFYIDLASYANQPSVFRKMEFWQYLQLRHSRGVGQSNVARIVKSTVLYAEALT